MQGLQQFYPAGLAVEPSNETRIIDGQGDCGFGKILSQYVKELEEKPDPELMFMQMLTFLSSLTQPHIIMKELDLPPDKGISDLNMTLKQLVVQYCEKNQLDNKAVKIIMHALSLLEDISGADKNEIVVISKEFAEQIKSNGIFEKNGDTQNPEDFVRIQNTNDFYRTPSDFAQIPNNQEKTFRPIEEPELESDLQQLTTKALSEGEQPLTKEKVRYIKADTFRIASRDLPQKKGSMHTLYANDNEQVSENLVDISKNVNNEIIHEAMGFKNGEQAIISEKHTIQQQLIKSNTELFENIVDRVAVALKNNNKQLCVKLKPEYLGQVIIKVSTAKAGLKAELFFENIRLSEAMKNCVPDLKEQIHQQGYNVTEVNIHTLIDGNQMDFLHQYDDGKAYQQQKPFQVSRLPNKEPEEEAGRYLGWGEDSSINYIV